MTLESEGLAASTLAQGPWFWPWLERRSTVVGGRLRRRRSGIGRWVVGGAAVLLALDGAASLLPSPSPPPPAVSPGGPAAWIDIPAPLPLYGLSGSPFARLPLTYAARRTASGEERQDVLTFGAFDGATPFLRLMVSRNGTGPTRVPAPDLLVDLARLASMGGLAVTRIGLPLHVMTRFGQFDSVEATVVAGAVNAPCVGFRLGGALAVGMAGLACGSAAEPLGRGALGCVLDRIDLLSAGDDEVLRSFFVDAERRRGFACGGPQHSLAWGPQAN